MFLVINSESVVIRSIQKYYLDAEKLKNKGSIETEMAQNPCHFNRNKAKNLFWK